MGSDLLPKKLFKFNGCVSFEKIAFGRIIGSHTNGYPCSPNEIILKIGVQL